MKKFRRLALAAGLLAGGFTALGHLQNAQAIDGQITTSSYLDNIEISPTLNCLVHRQGDTRPAFFGTPADSACGTFLAVGGTLYGPTAVRGGDGAGLATPRTAFTPVSQTPVVGTGTLEDPYKVTTVVKAGELFKVSQVDSYSLNREYYRTQISVERLTAAADTPVKIWHAADCKVNDKDNGYGFKKAHHTVGCQSDNDDHSRGTQIVEMVPREGDAKYFEGAYNDMWHAIGTQTLFSDTCKCGDADNLDNAIGLSWAGTVNAPLNVSLFTNFSPAGKSMVNEAPVYWSAPDAINAFLTENNSFYIDARDFDPFITDFPSQSFWDDALTVTVDPPAAGDPFSVTKTDSDASRNRVLSQVTVVPSALGDFVLHTHVSDGYYTINKDITVHVFQRQTVLKAWAATIDLTSTASKIPLAMNATLTSGGQPLANKVVFFLVSPTGGSCYAVTNASGFATCQIIVSAVQAVLGLGNYQATFIGDNRYLPSYSRGRLINLGLVGGGGPSVPALPLP